MPDAAELLKQDHRKAEALFERYRSGDGGVVKQVCSELTVHTAIEEQVLYPALAEMSQGRELREQAEHEHQDVVEAITRIESCGYGSPEARACMFTVIAGVTHHVKEEETRVLPMMQRELGSDRMTALGDQLMAAKREELVRVGALVDLRKEELYELARDAEVAGRSDMNKEQLIQALKRTTV